MDFPQGADACVPATGSGVPTRADFVAEPSFPSRFSRAPAFRQTTLRPIPEPNPRPDPGSIPGQTT